MFHKRVKQIDIIRDLKRTTTPQNIFFQS